MPRLSYTAVGDLLLLNIDLVEDRLTEQALFDNRQPMENAECVTVFADALFILRTDRVPALDLADDVLLKARSAAPASAKQKEDICFTIRT